MVNTKNGYVDSKELEKTIKRDIKKGELSKEAKELIYIMINNMSTRNNFKGYDEDTVGDMIYLAFEYINRYWKNYKEYRYEIFIDGELDDDLTFRIEEQDYGISIVYRENSKQTIIKIHNIDRIDDIKKFLDNENIDYELRKTKNSIFSYFSSYIWNAFIHTIKNRNFLYKSGESRYTGTNIYSLNKEDNLTSNKNDYDSMLIQNDDENSVSIKIEVDHEPDVIYDRHKTIDLIFANSDDIEDIIKLSYKFIEESSKNTKIIYNDPTLLYILMKNLYNNEG